MSASVTPETVSDGKSYYFVNRWVDFFMIGGISILAFFAILFTHGHLDKGTFIVAAFYLQWVINFPHFSATNYRFYSSKEHLMQYPVTAFVLPFVMLLGIYACIRFPALFAPYFASVYLLWSPYHFSAQSMGITMLYGARTGFFVGKRERLALSTFLFGSYIVMYLRAGASAFATVAKDQDATPLETLNALFFGVPYMYFDMPALLVSAVEAVTYAAGLIFIMFFFRACRRAGKMLPLFALMPMITHAFWFVLGYKFGLFIFVMFIPLFHSIQYLLVAWSVHINSKLMQESEMRPGRKVVMSETVYWIIANLLGGFLLFGVFPLLLIKLTGTSLLIAVAAVYAGVQIHHFFVDGVIWKLRNNNTLGSPLMWNINDLVTHREQQRQGK